MTTGTQIGADTAAILRTLQAIIEPDQVTELRAPKAESTNPRYRHTVSGYFDHDHLDAMAKAATTIRAPGVYFIPNPVNPALLARSANRVRDGADDTTGDADILRRRWLKIDADPRRPAGISSTDAEHRAALDKAAEIAEWLTLAGWPDGLSADSGNGGHLLYRVDLPTHDDGLLQRILEALALRFNDAMVGIDTTTFNPCRIWKLYGTVARKGDDTPERPHRLAGILHLPDTWAPVPRPLLDAVAAMVPREPERKTATGATFDLDRWIHEHLPDAKGPVEWSGTGRKWILPVCPWNPEHTGGSAYIGQLANGAIAAGCHHNGCRGRDWAALRALFEPGRSNRPPVTRPAPIGGNGHERGATLKDTAPTDQAAPLTPCTLDEVLTTFRKWLLMEDAGPLYVNLAAIVANMMPGDPVWLLTVGVPGGGKTEILQATTRLQNTHQAATLTEGALLSGTSKREKAADAKGGLLREIGDFGILLIKDFGSILSLNKDTRGPLLQALREIYDGAWTRHVGTDGGRTLQWQGKVGLIGGATPAIDAHHSVMSILGERFIFYRLPELKETEHAKAALKHIGQEQEMRAELARSVQNLFLSLTIPTTQPALTDEVRDWLILLARMTARCRAPVLRDSFTREVEQIPGAEAPTRLVLVLAKMLTGLTVIGLPDGRAYEIVCKMAFDSMPQLRRKILEFLSEQDTWTETAGIAVAVKTPTNTTRRAIEDLQCYALVDREPGGAGKADTWAISDLGRELYIGAQTLPEIREGMHSEQEREKVV